MKSHHQILYRQAVVCGTRSAECGEPPVKHFRSAFSLVLEFSRPVAALLPARLTHAQYVTLFALLPRDASNSPILARRWELASVICSPDWERAQLRRVPMLPPKNSIPLCFL